MEIVLPILIVVAIAFTALSGKAKPQNKANDEAIDAAYWKGYKAGYNARANEARGK